ncbi:MAG: hypothetical protein H8E21_12845 [Gammaproteobacteria bacterium]|nr:hypothetical protein [Gammaproteobacteria bacterium]MBL6999579.1 hypothetical protein [Gammaproteobacteria bacterium]
MDNLITGLIAVGIFLTFVIGLAVSIGSIPFGVIVAAVTVMILVEFFQSAKQGLQEEKEKKQQASSQR